MAIFAAISQTFYQLTQCFMIAAAVALGMFLFFKGKTWCDKTAGKIGGKNSCDATRQAMFAAGVACILLVLVKSFTGASSGGYYGGGADMMYG